MKKEFFTTNANITEKTIANAELATLNKNYKGWYGRSSYQPSVFKQHRLV